MTNVLLAIQSIGEAIKNIMVWWRQYGFLPPSERVIKEREDLSKEKQRVEETGERPKWD